MRAVIVGLVTFASVLGGCSSIDTQAPLKRLINPTRFHDESDNNANSNARKAADEAMVKYFEALEAAMRADKSPGLEVPPPELRRYADTGIAVVKVQCLRWFQRVEDASRMLDHQTKNYNIISQLGTTLLGIGGANANIVGAYGAANTAATGSVENFNASFLLAPTTANVKDHIVGLLTVSEEEVRKRATYKFASFIDIYAALEQYASICTHSRAKAIVDAALSRTTSKLDKSGQPVTVPTDAKADANGAPAAGAPAAGAPAAGAPAAGAPAAGAPAAGAPAAGAPAAGAPAAGAPAAGAPAAGAPAAGAPAAGAPAADAPAAGTPAAGAPAAGAPAAGAPAAGSGDGGSAAAPSATPSPPAVEPKGKQEPVPLSPEDQKLYLMKRGMNIM